MTVTELESAARVRVQQVPGGFLAPAVLDLIADWRLMRERLMELRDCDYDHDDVVSEAAAALVELKIKP